MPIGYLSLVAVLLASGVVVVLIRSHRLESELKRYKNQVSSLQKKNLYGKEMLLHIKPN